MNFKLLSIEIWPWNWFCLSILSFEAEEWERAFFSIHCSSYHDRLFVDLFFIHLVSMAFSKYGI